MIFDGDVEEDQVSVPLRLTPGHQDGGEVLASPRDEHRGEQKALLLLTGQAVDPILGPVRHRRRAFREFLRELPHVLLAVEDRGAVLGGSG